MMQGKHSVHLLNFKKKRIEVAERMSAEVRKYGRQAIDLEYELAGLDTCHSFQSEEIKESCLILQNYCQAIMDKISAVSGLKNVKPKIYLTRSMTANAFVWAEHGEEGIKDLLELARAGKEVELPVFVHAGLVQSLRYDDELAGIFAHELTHLMQPAYNRQNSDQEKQRLEYDADKNALHLTDAAGFNPRGLLSCFESHNNRDIVSSLGMSSHPATESRITELEKEYHRKDLPLINSGKSMKHLPENMSEAVNALEKAQSLKTNDIDLSELERKEKLDEYLEQNSGADLYFRKGFNGSIHSIANSRLIEEAIHQELVHGTLGHRARMLNALSCFLAGLQLKAVNTDPDVRYDFENPKSYRSDIGAVPDLDEYFNAPKEEKYISDSDNLKNYELNGAVETFTNLEEEMKALGLETEIGKFPKTIEEWINMDNEYTDLFWKLYDENGVHDKKQRLNILMGVMRVYMTMPSVEKVCKIEKVTRYVIKRKEPIEPKPEGVLQMLPERLRTQKRKNDLEIEYEDVEVKKEKKESLFSSYASGLNLPHGMRKIDYMDQAPLIRGLARTLHDKSIDAYREILTLDGVGQVDPKVLEFILLNFYNNSNGVSSNQGVLLDGLDNPTITFLDQVVRVLESKNLCRSFSDPIIGNFGIQNSHAQAYIMVIAFGLKPKNEQEKEIRENYLKRVMVDPFLGGNRGETPTYILYLKTDDRMLEHFDEEFVQAEPWRGDNYDLSIINLRSVAPSVSAHWIINKERFLAEMQSVLNGGESGAGLEIKEDVRKKIKTKILRAVEKKPLLNRMVSKADDKKEREMLIDDLMGLSALMGRYVDKTYEDVLPNHDSVKAMFKKEQQWYSSVGSNPGPDIVRFMVKEIAKVFDVSTLRKHVRATDKDQSDEDLLFSVFAKMTSVDDRLERYQEVTYLSNEAHGNVALDEFVYEYGGWKASYERYDVDDLKGARYLLYRKKDLPTGSEAGIDEETLYKWLEALAVTRPKAAELLKYLKRDDVIIYSDVMRFCMGSFIGFKKLGESLDLKYSEVKKRKNEIRKGIKIARLCGAIYHDKWKNIEGFKRMDEQLSNWEWVYDNPFFGEVTPDKKEGGSKDNKAFIYSLLEKHGSALGKYYRCETGHGIEFSWPLLMIDLWNGDLDLKFIEDDQERENVKKMLDIVLEKMKEIVADKSNLAVVIAMQPGFFREFIIKEKMKLIGVKDTVEELHEWMPQFSSLAHEASENNQISSQVENVRREIVKKRKEALIAEAIEYVLPDTVSDEVKGAIIASTGRLNKMMVEMDCDIHVANKKELRDKNGDMTEVGKTAIEISERYRDAILERYKLLMEMEVQQMSEEDSVDEEDVYLFSDHVIENDKSRLEVGPVYRFQIGAQPLMDWHVNKLRAAGSVGEMRDCAKKVDEFFPDRHPLKDIYLKNQLNLELWRILSDEIGEMQLAEMGIALTEKKIDLDKDLSHFPLYKNVVFLKHYSVFKLEGLLDKFQNLPATTVSGIMGRLAYYIEEKVSEASKPGMRRLLFLMEEKAVWPSILSRRDSDPEIFEKYLSHIERFFPNPSLEKDNLLETIMMDLALNQAEVNKALNLRYAEQVLLPEQKESLALKAQYQAFEKIRFYVSNMDRIERAEFVLWLMGGEPPLANTLSIKSTGISLDGRKEVFWQMTPNERRNLLYEILQDNNGLFREYSSYGYGTPEPRPFPMEVKNDSMMRYLVEEIFEITFKGLLINEKLPADHEENIKGRDILKTIFEGLFIHQQDPVRRTELLLNIIEAIGTARKKGEKLGTPELIRLMAEQGGVVIVKFSQVLSEQPDLLPASIKEALSDLKDSATVVSKRSDYAYLQATGWLRDNVDGIAEVGKSIGSASIKQCRKGVLKSGQPVAIKTKKPSIEKYYKEDLQVVGKILSSLEEKYEIPSYLITEVEKVIHEELDFGREVDNHLALRESLIERKTAMSVEVANRDYSFPIEVVAPVAIYPNSSANDAGVGLMVEEFARGLSLNEIQKFQKAVRENNIEVLQKIRKRIYEVYPQQAQEIEDKIKKLDLEHFQSGMALELLKQIMKGGVFHADLHAGNIFLDLLPCSRDGEIHQGKVVLIDLGSMGYSNYEKMPKAVRQDVEEGFDVREEFKDFLSALFSQSGHTDKIAEIINKFTGLKWTDKSVSALIGKGLSTQQKVKKIFYEILKDCKDSNAEIDMQFRYFLKAIATSADHLDNLKNKLMQEMMYMMSQGGQISNEERDKMFYTILQNERLLNFGLIF